MRHRHHHRRRHRQVALQAIQKIPDLLIRDPITQTL